MKTIFVVYESTATPYKTKVFVKIIPVVCTLPSSVVASCGGGGEGGGDGGGGGGTLDTSWT